MRPVHDRGCSNTEASFDEVAAEQFGTVSIGADCVICAGDAATSATIATKGASGAGFVADVAIVAGDWLGFPPRRVAHQTTSLCLTMRQATLWALPLMNFPVSSGTS